MAHLIRESSSVRARRPESVILSKDEGAKATEAASKDPEDIGAINAVSRRSHETAWGELPDTAWRTDTLSGSFDASSVATTTPPRAKPARVGDPGCAPFVLAQDDRG